MEHVWLALPERIAGQQELDQITKALVMMGLFVREVPTPVSPTQLSILTRTTKTLVLIMVEQSKDILQVRSLKIRTRLVLQELIKIVLEHLNASPVLKATTAQTQA